MNWSVHHVNLAGHNVREMASFYQNILGMDETKFERAEGRGYFRDDPEALAIFGEHNRGIHIVKPVPTFARDNNLQHNPTIGGHVAINLPDLDAVCRRLDAAGVLYSDAGEFAMLGYRQVYVYDPSMNLIELNQKVR